MRKRPGEHLKFRMNELIRLFRHRGLGRTEIEIIAAINAAIPGDLTKYTARQLGELIQLTLLERAALNIRTIAAVDCTEKEKIEFYAARRRRQDQFRKQRARRKRQRMMPPAKSRAELRRDKVLSFLKTASKIDPSHWLTVDEVAGAVARSKAFRGLKPKAMRTRIHEALAKLAGIEISDAIGTRGLPLKLIRLRGSADSNQYRTPSPGTVQKTRPHTHRSA